MCDVISSTEKIIFHSKLCGFELFLFVLCVVMAANAFMRTSLSLRGPLRAAQLLILSKHLAAN